jgi:hypothetical protein
MSETKLHDLVIAYRRDGADRERIMEKVAELVYEEHSRYGFDDEDDAADALLRYRRRIERLVDRFEDRGQSFDAYLATSLRYLARSVRRDRRFKADRELVCERLAYPSYGSEGPPDEDSDPFCCPPRSGPSLEDEPVPARPAPRKCKRRPRARGGALPPPLRPANSSRLVYLAIKCAWEIDEAGIERVAASAGIDPAWLSAAVEQARRSLCAERERVDRLVERRNSSWCRQRILEARLEDELSPERRLRLEASLERERLRFERLQAELGLMRIVVPNSVVARIVGVPKGTVDSGLYYLRKRFGEGGSGACLRGAAEAMVGGHGTLRGHGQRP